MSHAVAQAIAAERLEGWEPTPRQIADLDALACDEMGFGEFLARHRGDYPAAAPAVRARLRLFRRHDPYLYSGTSVLRNNFGIESAQALDSIEYLATAGRLVQWHKRLAARQVRADDIDIRQLHQHAFADVYPWAGTYRTTELRRADSSFLSRSMVATACADIEHAARQTAASREPDLAYRLARIYAEYNHVHPFREGNGRTGTLLLHTVAALRGGTLDLSLLDRTEWYEASRDSMPFRRDGHANPRPFIPLMVRALR